MGLCVFLRGRYPSSMSSMYMNCLKGARARVVGRDACTWQERNVGMPDPLDRAQNKSLIHPTPPLEASTSKKGPACKARPADLPRTSTHYLVLWLGSFFASASHTYV